MKVARWGNSLALRIPSIVVDVLDLKEGDDVDIRVSGQHSFEISRDDAFERALERIRSFKIQLPDGWVFDRDEANER